MAQTDTPPKVRKLRHIPGACGADEAGRGPLAGPVVAAACILPKGFRVAGIDDSKKLGPEEREELFERITAKAIFAIELSEPAEIDRLNILHASMAAMSRAIRRLEPEMVYVDGNRPPPDMVCPVETVIKGDGKFACIAAASILAKVTRDRLMTEYAKTYPGYGFDRHFGYPTPEHLATLRDLGPCPLHRRSFAPVREAEQPCLLLLD